ncbi:MAG: actin-like protein arp8 [Caeruleum heppii]|nr:MAG: actin-like protein arp8 [Caeruleum heppii]
MVGKKSGKALLREEGLERTDNNLNLTTWPQISMINQKNYYTEYLKRDDQLLVLRLQNEENRNLMTKAAKDRDRALAQATRNELPLPDPDAQMEDADAEGEGEETEQEPLGSKTIVIHPGSQNLRIGLASDALPKTIPMVIARRSEKSESELDGGEPRPKRRKRSDGSPREPERMFGEDFASQYHKMCAELKVHMRNNKRRVLPTSKELVVNYNRRTAPEIIPEHNDPSRVEWTETSKDIKQAPEHFTGLAALRIPDESIPRYRLYWPLRYGCYNEGDYPTKTLLYEDIATIIEDAITTDLGLRRKKSWNQYSCVFVIPDIYERTYVTTALEMLLRDFGFARVCFIQESLAATFGSGYSNSCIVDVGAQKTSVCCVEEGMCIENSRINLKYGGADVTETFTRMMLFDHFPYGDFNLNKRHDFLLAEELKQKFCTMNEADISVQLYDFHLRVSGQDTRKYAFKTYDEVILAPSGFFQPSLFENADKLRNRRKLIDRSYDLYDGSPNDPVSAAQVAIYDTIAPPAADESISTAVKIKSEALANGHSASTPLRNQASNPFSRLNNDALETTPRSSVAGSPAPEGSSTPQPNPSTANPTIVNPVDEKVALAARHDSILPIYPLDSAILLSIAHATSLNDERKTRDFLGGIMIVGGGAGQIPGFCAWLEDRLRALRPGFAKDVMVGQPPRELDPMVVVWKGASVFGKLGGTSESWVGRVEFERLGGRVLAYKCMWPW